MNTVLMVCLRRFYKKKIQLLSTNEKHKEVSTFNIEDTTSNKSKTIIKAKKFKKVTNSSFLNFVIKFNLIFIFV